MQLSFFSKKKSFQNFSKHSIFSAIDHILSRTYRLDLWVIKFCFRNKALYQSINVAVNALCSPTSIDLLPLMLLSFMLRLLSFKALECIYKRFLPDFSIVISTQFIAQNKEGLLFRQWKLFTCATGLRMRDSCFVCKTN